MNNYRTYPILFLNLTEKLNFLVFGTSSEKLWVSSKNLSGWSNMAEKT